MPQNKPNQKEQSVRWLSIWQLLLSLFGILVFWGLAFTLLLMILQSTINAPGLMSDSIALLLMVAGFAFIGVLMIPSAVLSSLSLFNKPVQGTFRIPRPASLFFLFTVLLGLGYLAAKQSNIVWVVLPPIHVIAIGIAILWMIKLGTRGLPTGSAQRQWGIFNLGLVAAPVLSLLIEFVVIIIVGFMGIAYLGREPGFSAELSQLYQGYLANPNLSLDTIITTLEPYLMQPVVIYVGLVVIALLVPLIEETIKPIGVWLLAGRKPTPAHGFAAGVLSGGGFALFENLTLSATSGEDWALVVASRIGTSIIHIITTGLTGWALASAWSQKKYLRLGASFLAAVAIHALWNGLVILSIVPEFFPGLNNYPDILENIGLASPLGYLLLLVGSFILLFRGNYSLRNAIIPPVVEPEIWKSQDPENHFSKQTIKPIPPRLEEESESTTAVGEEK